MSVAARGKKSAKKRATPRSLKDLQADPQNLRRHSERNVAMIRAALGDVGAGRSIVIDGRGIVRAGNATVQAALAEGGFKLRVVDTDAKTLVAVRRRDLSDDALTRLAIFDNRAPELAEWDADALEGLTAQGWDLTPFFHADELKILALPPDLVALPSELDADVASKVKHATCPKCGKRFPV